MKQQGSCLCGQVKYETDNNFKVTMNCHCRYCRKAHAAPYVTAALMPAADVTIKEGEKLIARHEVSGGKKRCFCSACGTRLFNEISVPGFITLMVGTLDHPEQITPIAHVNLESKLESLTINDNLAQYQAFPSQEDIGKMLSV